MGLVKLARVSENRISGGFAVKTYVWVSFAFMGWAYYELSGGSDFVPQQPVVAEVEEAQSPEIVARADSDITLISVSTSNVAPAPVESAPVAEPVVAATSDIVEEPQVELASLVAPEPQIDLRAVGSSRVNMRMGPSTDFDVITTLNSGTELEVIDVTADGWANVRTVDRGIEGWMAERLLTDPRG